MPYNSVSDVPDYVPEGKRKQWLEVWNSSYKEHHDESRAFAEANSVTSKVTCAKVDGVYRWYEKATVAGKEGEALRVIKAAGTEVTGFVRAVEGPFRCGHCGHMEKEAGAPGYCVQPEVNDDPELKEEPRNDAGYLLVAGGDCCNEYDSVDKAKTVSARRAKAMGAKFKKFIPFVKVDAAKREVWGIVTAEVPDKDNEVCDYEKSKPFYQALISEMSKATEGRNFFPLREMHQLSAVGKGVGFEFRDNDKEIYMGFKVVDDNAWKKVEEGVYTGFSQGGSIVGDLTPDPVYKNCMRYVADPSECSVVDNPCLGVAHFTYVKTDGVIELRKLRSEFAKVDPPTGDPPAAGPSDVPTGSSAPATGIKYLVEENGRQFLPYTTSEGKPDHRLMNMAWAALTSPNPTIPGYEGPDKEGAIARLKDLYQKEGLDTPSTKAKKVLERMRPVVRKWASKNAARVQKLSSKLRNQLLYKLDTDIGVLARKQPLAKGMYEVSRLACSIEDMAYLVCGIQCEQEWEQDTESKVASKLAVNVNGLLDTFLEYAEEETKEMRADLTARLTPSA